jgi:hypothetical protein
MIDDHDRDGWWHVWACEALGDVLLFSYTFLHSERGSGINNLCCIILTNFRIFWY